ncbi:fimbrial protein [Klebsiella michiganensis]|uniref:fimbrial protein n=1 Tax=Klebsiella michiganensis TaxID=1134687 RepID=UPI0025707B0C|nr:fimbrial protein [Klebsiella michiganensis]MDL4454798.1 fimbrial protein [Klebsiella michiganensis]
MYTSRLLKAVSLIGVFCVVPRGEAADVTVQVVGNLVANSCTVSPDSKNKTVDMGTWATKQFVATPLGVPPVRFVLNLENCGGAVSGVKVSFTSTPDKDDNTLLALNTGAGAATNLGIAILDKDKNRIPLGKPSSVYSITPGAASVPMVFYGQYVATVGRVTPGTANADATFTLDYQ